MRGAMVALVACAGVAVCATPAVQAQGTDAYGGLPPGEGRELVFGTCTACHSTRIILQQGMSRTKWDHTLDWMIEKQGMPELPEDMREQILDYLAEHFPAEREDTTAADRGAAAPPPTGLTLTPLPLPGE